jgi:hypothetical protein
LSNLGKISSHCTLTYPLHLSRLYQEKPVTSHTIVAASMFKNKQWKQEQATRGSKENTTTKTKHTTRNRLEKPNGFNGFDGPREHLLYYCVVTALATYFIFSLSINVALMLPPQMASSVSMEKQVNLTRVGFLLCPHFTNNFHTDAFQVKPHLIVFKHQPNGIPTFNFQTSQGDRLDGEIYPFRPPLSTAAEYVEPKPIPQNFFQNSTAGCIAAVPHNIDPRIIDGPSLGQALNDLAQGIPQSSIAPLVVGFYCEICYTATGKCEIDAKYCRVQTLLVNAFSMAPGDYDLAKDSLTYNLDHPCLGKTGLCRASRPSLYHTMQVPANTKGVISIDTTETRPPQKDLFCTQGCEADKPTYVHDLTYLPMESSVRVANALTIAEFTLFVSAKMSNEEKTVVTLYFTTSSITVATAMSGLVSLLLMVMGKLFPKVDKDQEKPTMVTVTNPIVKKILYCTWCNKDIDVDKETELLMLRQMKTNVGDGGGGGGGENKENSVENPAFTS